MYVFFSGYFCFRDEAKFTEYQIRIIIYLLYLRCDTLLLGNPRLVFLIGFFQIVPKGCRDSENPFEFERGFWRDAKVTIDDSANLLWRNIGTDR